MKRWLVMILVIVTVGIILAVIFRDSIARQFMQPTESSITVQNVSTEKVVAAKDLTTPWAVVFLPNGDMLVPEREGTLQRIGANGVTFTIDGVQETSEGGLLGVALAPDFNQSSHIYIYYTASNNGSLTNQVDRYTLQGNQLTSRTQVIANIPAASNHNGGSIAFGPDNKLYITTDDAATPNLAQDTASLAGKILRLNEDGTVPADNPFNNATWSYGHRNPQGIAWDDNDQLWSVEHGPSGADTGRDELNRITKGANYGWPTITGDEAQQGMQTPVAQSGFNETWAPGGLAYLDGALYFAGLRGQSLYKVDISSPDNVSISNISRLFANEYGRLRAVTAHDGDIYFTTSNRDGRGSPKTNDDQIIRFKPE